MSLIAVDPTAPGATDIQNLQAHLRAAADALRIIETIATFAAADGDIPAAEAFFGLPAGSGPEFYAAVQAALEMMNGTASEPNDALRALSFKYYNNF